MTVTQMPTYGNNQPYAAYFGSNEGIPEGGSSGGGKRPNKPAKKTTPKKGGGKASKKGSAKRK